MLTDLSLLVSKKKKKKTWIVALSAKPAEEGYACLKFARNNPLRENWSQVIH